MIIDIIIVLVAVDLWYNDRDINTFFKNGFSNFFCKEKPLEEEKSLKEEKSLEEDEPLEDIKPIVVIRNKMSKECNIDEIANKYSKIYIPIVNRLHRLVRYKTFNWSEKVVDNIRKNEGMCLGVSVKIIKDLLKFEKITEDNIIEVSKQFEDCENLESTNIQISYELHRDFLIGNHASFLYYEMNLKFRTLCELFPDKEGWYHIAKNTIPEGMYIAIYHCDIKSHAQAMIRTESSLYVCDPGYGLYKSRGASEILLKSNKLSLIRIDK